LNFRRGHEEVFARGDYVPVEAAGPRRDHVCAFARRAGDAVVLVAVPRLVARLAGGVERPPLGPDVWGETRLLLPAPLAGRHYRNLFTGEELAPGGHGGAADSRLARVLGRFPVALLWSGGKGR
jgi:(1->4)-alpha-D-glucan 1-alpha-D-glucosylmutase